MKALEIIQSPAKILSTKTKRVYVITPTVKELIKQMKYTLSMQENPRGVGLAAPQVGKSLQLFVVREEVDQPFKVFINPKITLRGEQESFDGPVPELMEGCLSIPKIWGIVDRAPMVGITYTDEKGETQTEELTGFTAQIIQHEYDHLQGLLFPMRVLKAKKELYRSSVKKGKQIFTPVGPSFNL